MKRRHYNKGTTLLETLIAVAFFVGVSIAMYSLYAKVFEINRAVRSKEHMSAIGNEMLEIVRNIPYDSLGTTHGIPLGVIEEVQDIERGGQTFRVEFTIRNIDLPFDGLETDVVDPDTDPADSKIVEILVRCEACDTYGSAGQYYRDTFTTVVGPDTLESTTSTGSLYIYAINPNGTPLGDAEVNVINTSVSPAVSIDDNTDVNGVLKIIGAEPSVEGYQITVTNTLSSADQTYDSTDLGGSTPVKAHATVVAGDVTEITFQVGKLSTLDIESVDSLCVPVPNFDFNLLGEKLLGTVPNYYKYDQDLATNGSGLRALSDMEWDDYLVTPLDATYDLIGSNPLLDFSLEPNTDQDLQLVVQAKNRPTVMVTVKDSVTGLALTDADVQFERDAGGYDSTKTTGVGSFTQTDWSGGTGTANWTEGSDEYFSNNGNVNHAATPGLVRLRNSGATFITPGNFISSTFDTGTVSNFYDLTWSPTSQHALTGTNSLKFQIASNNDNVTWNFVGPDNTSGTYYTTSDFDISNHNGNRYLRYKAYLSTDNTGYTPSVTDVSFTYASGCTPSGQVQFSGLATGAYTLTVQKSGYNDTIVPVTVSSGTWQHIEVSMEQ